MTVVFTKSLIQSLLNHRLFDQKDRIHQLMEEFIHHFKTLDGSALYRSPGRLEVIGNHTDHQHGLVVASAIDRDTLAIAAPNSIHRVRVISAGYEPLELTTEPTPPNPAEFFTTQALIRGLIQGFAQAGYPIEGVDVVIHSTIPPGSGLSSSASFELLMAVIFNRLFADSALSALELAKMSQWTENVYFNKPCGLMDQCAIAVGGLTAIDFADPAQPVLIPLSANILFTAWEWLLVQVGHSHAELSHAYAQIVDDCHRVARYFHKTTLREVDPQLWLSHLGSLQTELPTRALLRSKHILDENQRVERLILALQDQRESEVPALIQASGDSSRLYLANILAPDTDHQPLALGLALAETLLEGQGAYRVHGGGFGGSMLVLVPPAMSQRVTQGFQAVFGQEAVLRITPGAEGAGHITSF